MSCMAGLGRTGTKAAPQAASLKRATASTST